LVKEGLRFIYGKGNIFNKTKAPLSSQKER